MPENRRNQTCAMCGKSLKGFSGLFAQKHLNMKFCSQCYGYVAYNCKNPEDVEYYKSVGWNGLKGRDAIKAFYAKDTCDLCGRTVDKGISLKKADYKYVSDGMICADCEKRLRPYYPIDPADVKATGIVNAVSIAVDTALSLATNTALDPFGTVDVEDPMKNASIEELKSRLIADEAER